jgi:type II secretory pathway component PulK
MNHPSRQQDDSGAALILVLWICVVIALLAGAFVSTVRLEARRQFNTLQAATARAGIDTGLAHAVAFALHPEARLRWFADGRPYRISEDGLQLTIRVWDEAERLDLNQTPPNIIRALLGQVAGPDGLALAQTILKRRDLPQGGGRDWTSVMELAAEPGVDAALLAKVLPVIGVHSPLQQTDAPPPRPGEPARELAADAILTVRVEVVSGQAAAGNGAAVSAEAVIWMTRDARRAFRVLEWRDPAPPLSLPTDSP